MESRLPFSPILTLFLILRPAFLILLQLGCRISPHKSAPMSTPANSHALTEGQGSLNPIAGPGLLSMSIVAYQQMTFFTHCTNTSLALRYTTRRLTYSSLRRQRCRSLYGLQTAEWRKDIPQQLQQVDSRRPQLGARRVREKLWRIEKHVGYAYTLYIGYDAAM